MFHNKQTNWQHLQGCQQSELGGHRSCKFIDTQIPVSQKKGISVMWREKARSKKEERKRTREQEWLTSRWATSAARVQSQPDLPNSDRTISWKEHMKGGWHSVVHSNPIFLFSLHLLQQPNVFTESWLLSCRRWFHIVHRDFLLYSMAGLQGRLSCGRRLGRPDQ